MSAVVATSLTQRYGSEVALDCVDLAVDAGEHLAVLGENGAGKTTLLRILATAARPTSGTLEIFGLDALVERRRLRARIGYVAHAPGLYPALSAAENLAFFCTLQGVDRGRVAEVLDLVGLAELASRLATNASARDQPPPARRHLPTARAYSYSTVLATANADGIASSAGNDRTPAAINATSSTANAAAGHRSDRHNGPPAWRHGTNGPAAISRRMAANSGPAARS